MDTDQTDEPAAVGWRFRTPPGWPEQPVGWRPPAGWAPDPQWPAAPPGWQFWEFDTEHPDPYAAPAQAQPVHPYAGYDAAPAQRRAPAAYKRLVMAATAEDLAVRATVKIADGSGPRARWEVILVNVAFVEALDIRRARPSDSDGYDVNLYVSLINLGLLRTEVGLGPGGKSSSLIRYGMTPPGHRS